MTTVVNIKRKNVKYDIYIGRGSKWGNPFVMKFVSTSKLLKKRDPQIAPQKTLHLSARLRRHALFLSLLIKHAISSIRTPAGLKISKSDLDYFLLSVESLQWPRCWSS